MISVGGTFESMFAYFIQIFYLSVYCKGTLSVLIDIVKYYVLLILYFFPVYPTLTAILFPSSNIICFSVPVVLMSRTQK